MARREDRRKRIIEEEPESHERWLVSYADFITLLFAFFIVLYATSERNLEKTKEFQQSIQQFLVKVSGGGPETKGSDVNEAEKYSSLIEPPIRTFRDTTEKTKSTQEQVEVYIENEIDPSMREKFLLDINHDPLGVRVAFYAADIFKENTDQINKNSFKILDLLSLLLKNTQAKIIIESHTDKANSRPKPAEDDWQLAAMRSTEVVQYLIQRHGFDPKKLAAISYGSERPIFPESNAENKRKNQRLEFLILTEEGPF